MSSSKVFRTLSMVRRGSVVAVVLALAACTSGPVYAPQDTTPGAVTLQSSQPALLTELRGRVAVAPAETRTAQIFRNALLYRLNGPDPVASPLYEVRFSVVGSDSVSSIESGSGVPTASVYRMQADYTVIRLSDGATIGAGSRFSTAPYDRSAQLYASQRAVVDARDKAGKELAERVAMATLPVLKRETGGVALAGASPGN